MDKYYEKILEIGKDADSIIQMLRSKKMSALEKIIDFIFTNSVSVVDGLSTRGVYYLVTKGNVSKLVHVSSELEIEEFDVTTEVQSSPNLRKFEYKGNYYKTLKKFR
ncbi:hypothetical protein ACJDT4_09640 [Clostridium neuense]|uniref:Uncharacterized protein n=1 Tax=Clostridium neuense TaxID=1728934 RepID=A0ABW8TEP4_9CLOT